MTPDILPAEEGKQDNTEISVKNLPWQVKLFLLCLVLPSEVSFNIGSIHFKAYRFILVLFFIPCFFHIFGNGKTKTLLSDWLLLAYTLWIIAALMVNHGFATGLESGGMLMLESLGAYLIARTFIKDKSQFSSLVIFLVFIVICLSFFTIPEALTGKNFLRPHVPHSGERLGLIRAIGPFDHAILYGVFCASIVSLALYTPTQNRTHLHKLRAGWVIVASFMSVSSGALAAVMIQLGLVCWEKITRGMLNRWRLLSFLMLLGYIGIDLLSNRTPIRVILHRLTFNADTAYNRLTIWEWGTKHNVAQHPFFGIGFSDWVRPAWMYSTSMDNFWLVNMVRYGLPSFLFLFCGVLYLIIKTGRTKIIDDEILLIRVGWLFSLLGFIIAGCTVHFWNNLNVWFFFLLGSGGWIVNHATLYNDLEKSPTNIPDEL